MLTKFSSPVKYCIFLNSFPTIIHSPKTTKLTMKKIILTTLLLSLAITGCQKQQAEDTKSNDSVTTQFEKSDAVIGKYLDQLDDPNTAQDTRIQILCKDYPQEYKTNYMPALLKLSPTDYTEEKLLKDLEIALDYYKDNFKIECPN